MSDQIIRDIMHIQVPKLAPTGTLFEALKKLEDTDIACVMIMQGPRIFGIFTESDAVRLAASSTGIKEEDMHRPGGIASLMRDPLFFANETAGIRQAFHEMATRNVRHLLVADAQMNLQGIVTLNDLLAHLGSQRFDLQQTAGTIVSRQPVTIGADETVLDGIRRMLFNGSSYVLITDEDEHAIGILSEKEVVRLLATNPEAVGISKIHSVMSAMPPSLPAETLLGVAADKMVSKHVRHLLIAGSNFPAVVTQVDIMRGLHAEYLFRLNEELESKERELRSINLSLEQKVQERVQELETMNLRLSNEIAERAKVEANLVTSERRYRQLFMRSKAVQLIVDPSNGAILSANDAAATFYGYSRSELESMNIDDVDAFNQGDGSSQMIHSLASEMNHSFQRHRLATGLIRDIEVYSSQIDLDGRTVIYLIVHDISERKQAEARAKMLELALENAGEAVLIIDRQWRVRYVNIAFSRINGYAPEEILGQHVGKLKVAAQLLEQSRNTWKTFLRRNRWEQTLDCGHKDGAHFPAIVSVAPIRDGKKRITHFVGIQKDISEFRELENRYRQSQKMQSLGTLVGGIAHNFNNALSGMLGYLYLAKKLTAEFPEVIDKLDKVETLAQRTTGTVRQLLTFARKGKVEMQPIAFTSFVREAISLAEMSLGQHINLVQKLCEEDVFILGDINQLQHAFLNLVGNAADAMTDVSNPCVEVSTRLIQTSPDFQRRHPNADASKYIELTLRDNGVGIAASEQSKIFEPFYTTKSPDRGSGLGLSMVYGTLTQHNGYVHVDSRVGKGTSIRLAFPVMIGYEAELEVREEISISPGKKEKILIVDDNESVLSMASDVVESLGYQALRAINGDEAMQLVSHHGNEIALLLTDILMPGISGRELADQVRKSRPDLPVIFCSGYDSNDAMSGSEEHELSKYMLKPVPVEMLGTTIRNMIDKSASETAKV